MHNRKERLPSSSRDTINHTVRSSSTSISLPPPTYSRRRQSLLHKGKIYYTLSFAHITLPSAAAAAGGILDDHSLSCSIHLGNLCQSRHCR